jgi:hypothetical protein
MLFQIKRGTVEVGLQQTLDNVLWVVVSY